MLNESKTQPIYPHSISCLGKQKYSTLFHSTTQLQKAPAGVEVPFTNDLIHEVGS